MRNNSPAIAEPGPAATRRLTTNKDENRCPPGEIACTAIRRKGYGRLIHPRVILGVHERHCAYQIMHSLFRSARWSRLVDLFRDEVAAYGTLLRQLEESLASPASQISNGFPMLISRQLEAVGEQRRLRLQETAAISAELGMDRAATARDLVRRHCDVPARPLLIALNTEARRLQFVTRCVLRTRVRQARSPSPSIGFKDETLRQNRWSNRFAATRGILSVNTGAVAGDDPMQDGARRAPEQEPVPFAGFSAPSTGTLTHVARSRKNDNYRASACL